MARFDSWFGTEQDAAKKIQDFQAQNAGIENHLKAVEGYFKTVSR
jgi:hypothetical protein